MSKVQIILYYCMFIMAQRRENMSANDLSVYTT